MSRRDEEAPTFGGWVWFRLCEVEDFVNCAFGNGERACLNPRHAPKRSRG